MGMENQQMRTAAHLGMPRLKSQCAADGISYTDGEREGQGRAGQAYTPCPRRPGYPCLGVVAARSRRRGREWIGCASWPSVPCLARIRSIAFPNKKMSPSDGDLNTWVQTNRNGIDNAVPCPLCKQKQQRAGGVAKAKYKSHTGTSANLYWFRYYTKIESVGTGLLSAAGFFTKACRRLHFLLTWVETFGVFYFFFKKWKRTARV